MNRPHLNRRLERRSPSQHRLSGGRTNRLMPFGMIEALEERRLLTVSVVGDSLVIDGDEAGPQQDDSFVLALHPGDTSKIDVTINATTATYSLTGIAHINVDTTPGKNGGNDELTITEASNDFVNATVNFFGTGQNTLSFFSPGGSPLLTENHLIAFGPNPGQGSVNNSFWDTRFTNVAQINDDSTFAAGYQLEVAPGSVILANGAAVDTAINYTDQGNGKGHVSVGNLGQVYFTNKPVLALAGGTGNDTFNINNSQTPPTGLTKIEVDGGDPTASDTLIVNGIAGGKDDLTFSPSGIGAGDVHEGALADAKATANFVPLTYSNIEHIKAVGQSADSDALRQNGTVADDTMEVTPGATPDAGSVTGFTVGNGGSVTPFTFAPLTFQGFLGFVSFPAATNNANGTSTAGGNDTLIIDGTTGDDTFALSQSTFNGLTAPFVALTTSGSIQHVPITGGDNTTMFTLRGLNGNDTFNLNFVNLLSPVGKIPTQITIQGGDSDASSDTLNYVPRDGSNLAVDILAQTITASNVPAGSIPVVNFTGTEKVNLVGLPAGFAQLSVTGTSGNEAIDYTPTTLTTAANGTGSSGNFQIDGSGHTQFTFVNLNTPVSNAASPTLIFNSGAGGTNSLSVYGSSNSDLFQIDETKRTVKVNGLEPALLGGAISSLSAFGLAGDDLFDVTPAPLSNVAIGGLPVSIDGGDPQASDSLIIEANPAGSPPPNLFVVVNKGRTADTGVVRVYTAAVADPDISYKNVEVIDPNVQSTNLGGSTGLRPNVLFLGPDNYETDNTLQTAAFLGSGPTLQIQNGVIFPQPTFTIPVPTPPPPINLPGIVPAAAPTISVKPDEDWYRVVANSTGTLDFQVYFQQYTAGLIPDNGVLTVTVTDRFGNVITGFDGGANPANNSPAAGVVDNSRVRIPAVAGETYYLHITGSSANTVNGYNATIVNTPAPVPYDIQLNDVVAQGTVNAGATTTTFSATNVPGAVPLSTIDGFYNGKLVTFVDLNDSGTLSQTAVVTNYVAATHTFTLATALTNAPLTNTKFQVESNDTGRSQLDEVTHDNTPVIYVRLDDATLLNDLQGGGNAGNQAPFKKIPIPYSDGTKAGFRIAIFDGSNTQVQVGFAKPMAGEPGVYAYQFTTPLVDGTHFITAKVQIVDPSKPDDTDFGLVSQSLKIVVDTIPPLVYFGTVANGFNGLSAGSDSGHASDPTSFADRITNNATPSLFGTAEADAIVKVYDDTNTDGIFDAGDLLIGQTVATPLDGTNQYPNGRWTLDSTAHLTDGEHTLFVTAEDPAGEVSAAQSMLVMIDTTGPQITNVLIVNSDGSANGGYDLFTQKTANNAQGPTPLVFGLGIAVQDFPIRSANFPNDPALFAATANDAANYHLVGDHTGVIPIVSALFTPDPQIAGSPATGHVVLTFAAPLPDDKYTLTVTDHLSDPAGNALDGEVVSLTNGEPNFPSGDGEPGGNFVAGFTVDSRAEIGVYSAAVANIDLNGNATWDPQGDGIDANNKDASFKLGVVTDPSHFWTSADGFSIHDSLFNGNFYTALPRVNGDVAPAQLQLPSILPNGFDKLAAYGFDVQMNQFRWLIDTSGDGTIDTTDPTSGDIFSVQPANVFIQGRQVNINAIPVAGNFNGNVFGGEQIGLFDGSTFYLDVNNAHVINSGSIAVPVPMRGTPVVGDVNGDGVADLGTYLNGTFSFILGQQAFVGAQPTWSGPVETIHFQVPGTGAVPVAADMDGDHIDDLGLWVPTNSGVSADNNGQFYFLLSNDLTHTPGTAVPLQTSFGHSFTPTPLGHDLYFEFGNSTALPIVGNFDPPPASQVSAAVAPTSVGAVLGATSLASPAGTQWYSFSPLRTGSAAVTATGTSGNVSVSLYDSNHNLLATSSGPGASGVKLSQAITAGQQYLVSVTGNAAGNIKIGEQVAQKLLMDSNQNGAVSTADAVAIINSLKAHGNHAVNLLATNPEIYFDANLDNIISTADAVMVINYIKAQAKAASANTAAVGSALQANAASSAVTSSKVQATDAVFAQVASTPAAAAVTTPAASSASTVSSTASRKASTPSSSDLFEPISQ